MRFRQSVCSRCGRTFDVVKGAYCPEMCPQCIKAADDEKNELSQSNEVISRTLDKKSEELRPREEFENLIEYCVYFALEIGVSDLHLKTNRQPAVRKGGVLFEFIDETVKSEEVFAFAAKHNKLIENIDATTKTYDFAVKTEKSRFRCNLYHDINGWCCSLRIIGTVTTDFKALRIPEILKETVKKRSGLILITGPTGSGKSTTMSALVQHLNENCFKHIITIEDPIEFIYPVGKCLITQREIGNDAFSYETALEDALREDPDVIVVGEMRDLASIEAAIRAAETGHIVISTLHTRGSASTINRIIDVFPAEKQSQIRTQLSLNLNCCITQQLVPTLQPGESALATEVMIANDAVRAIIRENKLHILNSTIEINQGLGMHTMKQDLERLREQHIISQSNFDSFQIK